MPSLAELLPHAAPMILLSGYDGPESANAVEAWVDIDEKSPFYEAELGGVPGSMALEYMAQTMALLVGLYRRQKGLGPKMGFVLGSRKLTVAVPSFRRGSRYRVRAACTYQDDEFGSFDCEVRDAEGRVAACGTLTAFQPDDALTPERLRDYM